MTALDFDGDSAKSASHHTLGDAQLSCDEKVPGINQSCSSTTDVGMEALERGGTDMRDASSSASKGGDPGFWKHLLKFTGPGFLMSMAYIDPGNLASDINTGVQGYAIQCLSCKLGVATGKHLAEHCRAEYPPVKRALLWAIAELGIITCDMVEVIGGAVALQTLTNGAVPLYAGVLTVIASAFCALYLERCGMRALEAVFFALIALMGGTFGYMFFTAGVDYGAVAKGLVVPRMDSKNIPYAVGAMGAMLMPYNLYLQSSLVLSRSDQIASATKPRALRFFKIESAAALCCALLINIFIISVFACGFADGVYAGSVGLGNAGQLLGDRFGRHMQYIWGVGLLAASHAASITSTYAGQVVMSGFFDYQVSVWWRTLTVRAVTLGPTLLVAIVLGKHNDSFEGFTEWLNVSQSLVLPFLVIPLLMMTSSRRIMGDLANSAWVTASMTVIIAFLLGMNGYLAVSFSSEKLPSQPWAHALFWLGAAAYCGLIVYLCITPQRLKQWYFPIANRKRGGAAQTAKAANADAGSQCEVCPLVKAPCCKSLSLQVCKWHHSNHQLRLGSEWVGAREDEVLPLSHVC